MDNVKTVSIWIIVPVWSGVIGSLLLISTSFLSASWLVVAPRRSNCRLGGGLAAWIMRNLPVLSAVIGSLLLISTSFLSASWLVVAPRRSNCRLGGGLAAWMMRNFAGGCCCWLSSCYIDTNRTWKLILSQPASLHVGTVCFKTSTTVQQINNMLRMVQYNIDAIFWHMYDK